jgi:O-antigen/teichoic acid export membrane protein
MAYQIDQKKIAKNTIVLYLRMAFTMVIGFFATRITLEQLGVEDYGLNNLVGSIVSMLSFINGSMGTAVQRYYCVELGKENSSALKRVFGTGLFLHIFVALVTLIIAEIFAIFFLHKMNIPLERMHAAQVVFQVSILSMVLNIVSVPYAALLRARELFDKIAVVEIIQAVLRLLILYLLTVIKYDKLITLSFLGLGVTVYYIGSLVFMARKFQETHCAPLFDKELIKQMLSFISMLIMTVLCQLLQTQGLIMLINLFYGLVVNAAYAVATQVSHIVTNFAMNFKQSMIPQMMASYGAKDFKSMHKIINMGTKVSFLLMLMISVPAIVEVDFLLKLWLQNPPEHASHLVVLVLIGINISSFTYFLYQGVQATGQLKKQQTWMSVLYLVNILIVYIVFKLGANFDMALYVNMFISAVQCVVNVVYAKKTFEYPIHTFISSILVPCAFCVTIVVAVMLGFINYFESTIARFFASVVLSEFIIMLSGYFIVFNQSEKEMVRAIVRKVFHRKS